MAVDHGRRSFWRRLVTAGAAPAVVVASVEASQQIATALCLVNPICPTCGACQAIPTSHQFPSMGAWAQHLRTPQTIVCGMEDCRTEMTITFAR